MTRQRYVVLGSGRQGTTAAHDLAVHGDAEEFRCETHRSVGGRLTMMARRNLRPDWRWGERSVNPERYVHELDQRNIRVTRKLIDLSADPASTPGHPAK
jgi:hypothetical protein